MKFWIYAAVCFLIIGTLFSIISGDGAGAVEGMIGGVAVLIIVLVISGLIWVAKLPFKFKKKP